MPCTSRKQCALWCMKTGVKKIKRKTVAKQQNQNVEAVGKLSTEIRISAQQRNLHATNAKRCHSKSIRELTETTQIPYLLEAVTDSVTPLVQHQLSLQLTWGRFEHYRGKDM